MNVLRHVKLGMGLALLGSVFSAQVVASTALFTATADNDFVVVLSQGNSHQVVYRSNDGRDWKRPQSGKVKIDDRRLRRCSINFIAWDDYSVKQGFAASISGSGGTVYSGQTGMKSFATKVQNSRNNWANQGYPSDSQVNQIMNERISSPTYIHGSVNGTAPWGNISGLPAQAKWIWAKKSLYDGAYPKNFTVYRTPCSAFTKVVGPGPATAKKGMTWSKKAVNPINGVVTVGCKANGYDCNPYKGDQICTTALPMMCKKELNLPKPASVPNGNQYTRWSGNVIGTTKPVAPQSANINTRSKANKFCVAEFGPGWKVAGFHDGRHWNFTAYGNLGTKVTRAWVNIKDQANGNCWNQQ